VQQQQTHQQSLAELCLVTSAARSTGRFLSSSAVGAEEEEEDSLPIVGLGRGGGRERWKVVVDRLSTTTVGRPTPRAFDLLLVPVLTCFVGGQNSAGWPAESRL